MPDPLSHAARGLLRRKRHGEKYWDFDGIEGVTRFFPVVAVTPIVGGMALKGPTVEMMRALGHAPDPVEVARMYRDVAATFVLDERDRGLASAIDELGYRTLVTDTVMRDGGRKLAGALLGHV